MVPVPDEVLPRTLLDMLFFALSGDTFEVTSAQMWQRVTSIAGVLGRQDINVVVIKRIQV